jgi:3-oxoacyl-[acyl-carrier protein] reductase
MPHHECAPRVCLVTGGTRGIGRAIALRLARDGANVVATYHSGSDAADETAELLKATGAVFRVVRSDLSNPKDIADLIRFVEDNFGRLDCLINNAGRTFDGAFAALDLDDGLSVLDTNLLGTMHLCLAAAPLLIRARGTIVNVSSLAGIVGKEGQVLYATTKGGINGLTRMLARSLGPHGIRVNSVAPGFIKTEMIASLPESMFVHVLASTATKSVGEPEDVANAAWFLAGSQSTYVNGEILRIDGGFHR